jgi:hypothetical protein
LISGRSLAISYTRRWKMETHLQKSRREERHAREEKRAIANVRDYMELRRRNGYLLDDLLDLHSKYKRLCVDYNTDLKYYESKLVAADREVKELKSGLQKSKES